MAIPPSAQASGLARAYEGARGRADRERENERVLAAHAAAPRGERRRCSRGAFGFDLDPARRFAHREHAQTVAHVAWGSRERRRLHGNPEGARNHDPAARAFEAEALRAQPQLERAA